MEQHLSYRFALAEDLPEIVAIYNSIIASRMVTADMEPVTVAQRQAWFNQHSSEKYPLWMVENEAGETVGWLSFQAFYGRIAYAATAEVSIYLHPAQRQKGYGTRILKFAIAKAPELGIKTLLGFIFGHNQPSIRLFEREGFSVWGNFPGVAELDGVERDLLILAKRVSG